MCTGMTVTRDHGFYFGRNMDIQRQFGERVIITPRGYQLTFKHEDTVEEGYATIGMGTVMDDYPFYAEAANEKGLCAAGLNFPGFAKYAKEPKEGHCNVSAYELISWLLSRYASIDEAWDDLQRLNLLDEPFNEGVPVPPLHWLVSDRKRSVVIESTADGLKIMDNPVHVLTNNPTFDWHLTNLRQYLSVQPEQPETQTWGDLEMHTLGQGQGAFGLPGDFAPPSRFIKAAFLRHTAKFGDNEDATVSQFFHVLDAVAMVEGSVKLPSSELDLTTYASCISVDEGRYYYKTSTNSQLNAVDMYAENLDGSELMTYLLQREQNVLVQNG